MALHYIIDGYNIIKSDPSGSLCRGSLEEQRDRLVSLIRDRRPQGSETNRVTVVFDGMEGYLYASEHPMVYGTGSVRVMFGEGRSADERIVELAQRIRPGEAVVVTDDRGIRRLLGGSGARFMGAEEFRRRLREAARSGSAGDGDEEKPLPGDIDEELKKYWL